LVVVLETIFFSFLKQQNAFMYYSCAFGKPLYM